MTEMCDRVLKAGGPALLFENPKEPALSRRQRDSGAGQPVRHTAARRAGNGREGDDWRTALRESGNCWRF
jgi:hypothetical protein